MPGGGFDAALAGLRLFLALLAERLVHELLLVADHAAQLFHHLHHLLVLLRLGFVLPPRLKTFHEILHFGEHLLRLLARTALRHVFQVLHHALEVLLPERLLVLVLSVLLLLVAVLLRQLLHEFVERLPQLLHQLLDLFLGRPVLERLGELVLCVLERPLGVRQAAVLDPQRDLPELVDDALEARRVRSTRSRWRAVRSPR